MGILVKEIVKKRCNLPDGFEPTILSCFCGKKLNLYGAEEQQVIKWFEVHDKHHKEVTEKWPARKR